jgi:hypothetical protein
MRLFAALVAGGLCAAAARAAEPPPWPPVEEVVAVIRTNLADVPDDKLNAAAVEGVLAALAPDVLPAGAETNAPGPLLARTSVFPGGLALLRVGRVAPGLDAALADALAGLARTNGLRGLVLDARFAAGDDLAAAAAAAARLAGTNGVTLTRADEAFAAPGGTHAPLPLMILVNRRTTGAAEALAAAARHAAPRGLVLGARTAGQARRYRTVTLSTGAALRLAAEPVAVAGGPALGAAGVVPDLPVAVDAADEALWFEDPFRFVRGGAEVAARPLPRMTEADLVRRRQGLPSVTNAPGPRPVQDPVLARALDLLAGLVADAAP